MNFDPGNSNNFQNATFANARLYSSHGFFHADRLPFKSRFDGAVMNGCRLLIQKEVPAQHNRSRGELESVVRQIFSPEQLAAMHIDYDAGGLLGRLGGLLH
jgi:hypothetical protein